MAARKRPSQAVDVAAPRPHIQCWFEGCADTSICSIQTATHLVNVCRKHYAKVDRYEPAPQKREPGSDDA